MRKTRIVSLLLSLILAVSLCAPARAADLTEADDAIETADAADLEAAWGIHGRWTWTVRLCCSMS